MNPGDIARAACAEWDLPEPTALRAGSVPVFRAGDAVVRVAQPGLVSPVRLASWLWELEVRVPRVLHHGLFDAHEVTALAFVSDCGDVDWDSVGEMVRRLHDARPPADLGPLPVAATFEWWDVEARLAEVDDLLDHAASEGLAAAIAQHGDWRARAGESVVCHGDLHPGNVLQGPDGPVLLDWDLLCWAPRVWDHAPLLTWEHRWGGEPGVYVRFADGYGRDFSGDVLGQDLAIMRNVVATIMRLRAGPHDAAAAAEAQRRLAYWRGEEFAPQWRAM